MPATQMTSEEPVPASRQAHRRGCLFYARRGLLALVILIVALPLLGFTYESLMRPGDAARYPPVGQMIDVGGHRLHLICAGEGSPTVILEGGHGIDAR